MNAGLLPIFDQPTAYRDYDTAARAIPDCDHNRQWRTLGPGRPTPPDCDHNQIWRAAIQAAWTTYLDALDTTRSTT